MTSACDETKSIVDFKNVLFLLNCLMMGSTKYESTKSLENTIPKCLRKSMANNSVLTIVFTMKVACLF